MEYVAIRIFVCIYIYAVAKNGTLELHLRHDFNSIIFKIKSNICICILHTWVRAS